MNSRVGQQFGNYRLLQRLGEGGFAEVYLGEHIHLNTSAAIKILHTQLAMDDIEPFRAEARMIAHLDHPNIVRVLEFGVEGKVPYLVMDYAPEGTLRQRHPKGTQLPLDMVVGYVKQLAGALQFAHDEKLIHRDVKPENMLIGRHQEILLGDFGIALIAQSSRYQAAQDMAGTVAYMAPEQIQAHPRAASDQYSLGIVTYEWLSGDRPFHGSFMEIAVKHSIVPPPSLRDKLPTLPVNVEQVIMTALAKDYKDRFDSIQTFSTALEQASQPNSAPYPSSHPSVPFTPPQPTFISPDKAILPTRLPLQGSLTESFIRTEPAKQTSGSIDSNAPMLSSSQAQTMLPPSSQSTPRIVPTLTAPRSDTIAIPEETGLETHGIERVSPKTRSHVNIFDNFTMWLSANLVISTVGVGAIAIPFLGLGLWDSIAIIVIFNVLGVLPVAFFSTLGPKLGLRQMTISRFSFGCIGGIIMALFNVAACIGWSAVNVIIGGQLVASLSKGAVPAWVGVLIIAALTTVVSIYGYRYVHAYERFAWIPMAILFLILTIGAAPYFSVVATPAFSGLQVVSLITFGGAVYGFATGWSSYAADYNVNQPESTSSSRIFWLTFLGVVIPCVLLETLGVLLTSNAAWQGNFLKSDGDIGGLLSNAVGPLQGFGTAVLVLITLSVIANNVPNDYSLGLSMQVLGKPFQRVNRAIWTLIGAVIYVAIAIPAAKDFAGTLQSFLFIIAYWLGPWAIILILEHFVFRHRRYNVEDWNTPGKLPIGWAAIVSMLAGLVGVYLGASQQRFIGPIAMLLSKVDVGFELGIVLAAVVYLILRPIELRNNKR